MRFGGHQTFAIRDGWLYKGLELLSEKDEAYKLTHEFAMDYLGVGRNMAKSINHWLLATRLAERTEVKHNNGENEITTRELKISELGKLIWEHDPYFMNINTWWIIHINLVNNPEYTASWHWFFNKFLSDRFQKETCYIALERHEKINSARVPSRTTLERDISCLLSTYSENIPSKRNDPEDEIECPLVELGLMKCFRNSGFFEINRSLKNIPLEIFLYALSCAHKEIENSEYSTISFFPMINLDNSPSKIFLLSNEGIFELIMKLSEEGDDVSLFGAAGERLLRYRNEEPYHWAEKYYSRVE